MGVSKRMTFSDGSIIERREVDRSRETRLRQAVSRSQKGSNTRRKRVASLSRETYRNAARNRNFCHEITTSLARKYGLIAIEDLQIRNMVRSAAGTLETPGVNVAAKSELNRAIKEQTWGMLRYQLTYKAEWASGQLVAVNPRFTSQACSGCGLIDSENRKKDRYLCSGCGVEMDADVNAALNILHRALGENLKPKLFRAAGRTRAMMWPCPCPDSNKAARSWPCPSVNTAARLRSCGVRHKKGRRPSGPEIRKFGRAGI